jgi:uncharacterized membrane protein YtjA (UPF0391 family)
VLNRNSYFLIIAIVSGLLGAGGLAGKASPMAMIIFVIFLALYVISYLWEKRPPVI